jgi:hypothetical protein
MATTEAQKKANKKWRENNKDKYNAIQLSNNIKFYYQNKDKILQKKKEYYLKKKQLKEEEHEFSL